MNEDYDLRDFDGRFRADQGVQARFYTLPMQDHAATAEHGRPMFKDTEFVEILAAGNANNIVKRKATDEDRQRFHRQYAMFRRGVDEQLVGTPLTEVAWLTRSQVEELAYLRIKTLEALAGMDDNICGRHAGLYDLKKKATVALEAAGDMAPLTKLQEENSELARKVEELTLQLKELTEASKKKA